MFDNEQYIKITKNINNNNDLIEFNLNVVMQYYKYIFFNQKCLIFCLRSKIYNLR